MRNILLVASREFRQRVSHRGFLITTLFVPAVMIVVWLFTGSLSTGSETAAVELPNQENTSASIGYVDRSGLIQEIPQQVPENTFKAYPNVNAAEKALQDGQIDAYYLVPTDYAQTGQIERVSQELTSSPPDREWFQWVLVANLVPDSGSISVVQLRYPFNSASLDVVREDQHGQGREGGLNMLPFIVTIVVMMPLFTSGGYLFSSLTQEKGNRIMEILLVSLRPRQLLVGKLIGLAGLTLLQYAAWLLVSGVIFLVTGGGTTGSLGALGGLDISLSEVGLMIPFAMGGYALYASLMAGIGALSPDTEGSRTWVFIITLPILIPIYLWTGIVNAPKGPLAVILSLFPFSSPVTMLMRMTTITVPVWQIAASLALLALAVVGMIWLMARLFRARTLLSGEALSLRRFVAALSG
jgi:ABC-2 type transport system permease protein